jgi:hypothetical protein
LLSQMNLGDSAVAAAASAAGLSGPSIVVRPLGLTGDSAFQGVLEPLRELPAASMIKTPLAAALPPSTAGRTRWDERVDGRRRQHDLQRRALTARTGLRVDSSSSWSSLMLVPSDNVATNVADGSHRPRSRHRRRPGTRGCARRRSGASSRAKLPLIDDPAATGPQQPPGREAADLFERIARGTVPSAIAAASKSCAAKSGTPNSRRPRAGDRFAHKTGDTDETSHDGGILELAGGGRYVLVVYSELTSNDETDARFAAFMQRIRTLLAEA